MPLVSQKENDYQHEHMAHSARLGTSYKGTLKCCSLWWGGKFWAHLEPNIAGGWEIISYMTRIRNCLLGVCCSMRYLQTSCQESAQMVIRSYLYSLIGNMQGSQTPLEADPKFPKQIYSIQVIQVGVTLTSQPVNLAHQHWRTWLSFEQRIPLALFTVSDSTRKSEAQLAGTLLEHSRDSQKYPFLSSEVEINFVYRYPFLSLFWLFSYVEKISYIKSCGCYSFFYFLWKFSDFLEL